MISFEHSAPRTPVNSSSMRSRIKRNDYHCAANFDEFKTLITRCQHDAAHHVVHMTAKQLI